MEPTTDQSEKQWLADLRQGDAAALRRIFDRHYPLLLSDIYRYLPDEDTCKDLAQEVFVELWRKRSTLEIHSSLRAYLRRAAINRALNYLKANRRTVLDDPAGRPELADVLAVDTQAESEQDSLEARLTPGH
ncbi:MAG: sigma-70 family RNA polymerase sigma factor [Saprospirales bacterium]|nr:sigma-70 family RNA polymerase sigma factor [Saprospirales bacterium]